MKVEGRERREPCQALEVERLVEVPHHVLDRAAHGLLVERLRCWLHRPEASPSARRSLDAACAFAKSAVRAARPGLAPWARGCASSDTPRAKAGRAAKMCPKCRIYRAFPRARPPCNR